MAGPEYHTINNNYDDRFGSRNTPPEADNMVMNMLAELENKDEQRHVPVPEMPGNNLTIFSDCPELTLQIDHSPLRSAWTAPSHSFWGRKTSSGSRASDYTLYHGPAEHTVIPIEKNSACGKAQLCLRLEGDHVRGAFCKRGFWLAIGETFVYHVPVMDAMESFSITLTRACPPEMKK